MSFSEWKEVRLGDVAQIIMGQSPTGDTCNEIGEGTPLLNGPTEFTTHSPNAVQYTTDPKKISEVGDLLFCVRGSTTGRMNWADRQYAIGRGLASFRHKKGRELQPFLRGLIEFNLNRILAQATGSTFPNVSSRQLLTLEISVPNTAIQSRISSVLSCLDDKIELNRQTNQTLETIAQALFKEMCLPKGDELPEGWRVGKLGELVEVNMGQSPPGTSYNQEGIGVVFFQGKAEFGFRFPRIDKYTTEPKKYAKKFDSLLSVRAPVGTINMATQSCCIGRGLAAISGKENCWSFAFHLLKSLSTQFEMYNGEGTVFGSINKTDLDNIEIAMPPKIVIEGFEKMGKSIDELVYENEMEIQSLTILRDSLLPKLMKGEINVED